ncbi:MAG: ATP-dependent helicase HrpB [Cyclobacteriaceae bacterium]
MREPFDYSAQQLPVTEVIPEFLSKISQSNSLIVSAPPGAGKSTILPLTLLDAAWLAGKKIIMLEPRRLAAKSIATRMASLLGEKVGETVGYRIRFETRISENTQIEVVTEGILTRMLQTDNSLSEAGIILFDEFHERSIHADVALALAREAQQILRPELKIVLMSATLNIPQLADLLDAPVVESEGRQYPVEVFYTGEQDETMLPEMTVQTVIKAVNQHDGDVLVFLPGQGEIIKCEEQLRYKLKNFLVLPLYGQLPYAQQARAIRPDNEGRRKIVLATSIAETSLTIEGVKIVVDTGFGRTSRYDPKSGISRLVTVQISKDSADQRAGRAGRLSNGFCYRMWSKATQERMTAHRIPEIMESDLTSLVLEMANWGVTDAHSLTWLTPPPPAALRQAGDTLHQLGALENSKITDHGKEMHKLPCHPRIAHMLLEAEENGLVALAADIAPFLEERDPLPRGTGIDINLRIEALRNYRSNGNSGGRMARIVKIAESYRRIFNMEEDNSAVDDFETGILLAGAYPERIACSRPGNNAQFQLSNGKYAMAGHRDDLAHEPWLAVSHVDARDGLGKIFMASRLNPRDLMPLIKEQEIITWDTRSGGLIASLDMRIGSIVLKSEPLPDPDESHLAEAISEAIRNEGEKLLSFDEDVEQWQNRVLSLRKWRPGDGWPNVSTQTLLATNRDWLTPYLTGVKKPEDLKKLDLVTILNSSLDYEQQLALERLAPEKITVPTGSAIRLMYRADGLAPILSVRIQEVFGMAETPAVCDGQVPVLMHLLSPGFKPVQVTTDLKNFWNDTYFEVRKELKRRYAKHSWPDDPWNAEPTRRVKRKK